MLWGCFSVAGTEGLVKIEEKLNAPKYWDSLMKIQSKVQMGRRFTFKQDYDPKNSKSGL